MSSKLVWDGASRKGDAIIKDNSLIVDDLVLKTEEKQTLLCIGQYDDLIVLNKGDAVELVKYLNTIIPVMKES